MLFRDKRRPQQQIESDFHKDPRQLLGRRIMRWTDRCADAYIRDRVVAHIRSHPANDEQPAEAPDPGACPFLPPSGGCVNDFFVRRRVPERAGEYNASRRHCESGGVRRMCVGWLRSQVSWPSSCLSSTTWIELRRCSVSVLGASGRRPGWVK